MFLTDRNLLLDLESESKSDACSFYWWYTHIHTLIEWLLLNRLIGLQLNKINRLLLMGYAYHCYSDYGFFSAGSSAHCTVDDLLFRLYFCTSAILHQVNIYFIWFDWCVDNVIIYCERIRFLCIKTVILWVNNFPVSLHLHFIYFQFCARSNGFFSGGQSFPIRYLLLNASKFIWATIRWNCNFNTHFYMHV